MGRGPVRPINFSSDGPRPGPAHHFSQHGPRPGPAHRIFQNFTARPGRAHWIFKNVSAWPGPARPMTLAARPMRYGLNTGWPAISVGRPVDLTCRATGRPMCCPVLKGEGIGADVLFRCTCTVKIRQYIFFPRFFFPSGFRGLANEPHAPTTRPIFPHQRPTPMANYLLLLRRPQQQQPQPQQQQQQHLISAAATPGYLQSAAAIPAIATPPANDLSSERSK